MTTAVLLTAANQSGRHVLSNTTSRLITANLQRFRPTSLIRHLHTPQVPPLRPVRGSSSVQSSHGPTPSLFSLLVGPTAAQRPLFNPAWKPPFRIFHGQPPLARVQSRRFSNQQNGSANLLQFNQSRRKNVSYFRGRSPWRNASQSPRPSKPDPLSSKDPPGQLGGSKNLLDRLPDLPHRFHRPSKEELLAAATGFWSRLRVRFKWFSIRSLRPFNMDDISAFFSWFLVGHVIWILVGTTTFFSLVIFAVNTVFAQGKSNLLT